MDAETKEPIPFATIRYAARSLGTISNIEGKFKLHLPPEAATDSIIISCIGYEESDIEIEKIKGILNNGIYLQKAVLELKQLVVTNRTPKEIVKIAITKIPENYIFSPTPIKGFYRAALKENGRFVRLLEATSIVTMGYSPLKKQEPYVQYLNVRKSKDFSRFKSMQTGMLEEALGFDHVYEKKGFLNLNNLDLWQFELVGYTQLNKTDIFIIEGRFIADAKLLDHKASIYITAENYAVVKVDYQYSWHSRYPHYYNDSVSISDVTWQGTFLYNWSKEVNKYHLNYFNFQNKKELISKDGKQLAALELNNEYYVQEIKPSKKRSPILKTEDDKFDPEKQHDLPAYYFQDNPEGAVATEFYRTVLEDLKSYEESEEKALDSLSIK